MAISLAKRLRIYERDQFCCVTCGSTHNLTLDHKKPKSRGGSDKEENLQTMCKPCNEEKADKGHGPRISNDLRKTKKKIKKDSKKYKAGNFHYDLRKTRENVIKHEPGCDPVFGCVGHCQAKNYGHSILGTH